MSDYASQPARPVSLFTIVFVLALFAAFLLVVRYFYAPARVLPQNLAAENIPAELSWRATPEARRQTLAEQRTAEAKQLSSYGWADQVAGKVQLPIDRAMELTAQQYGTRK
jgi:hypothetical protein